MIVTHLPLEAPELQYWYTMDVPTDTGVYAVEVWTPKLEGRFFTEAVQLEDCHPGEIDVPEPGSWVLVLLVLILMLRRLSATI